MCHFGGDWVAGLECETGCGYFLSFEFASDIDSAGSVGSTSTSEIVECAAEMEAVKSEVGCLACGGNGGVAADFLGDAVESGGLGLGGWNHTSDVALRRTDRGGKGERTPVKAVIDFDFDIRSAFLQDTLSKYDDRRWRRLKT